LTVLFRAVWFFCFTILAAYGGMVVWMCICVRGERWEELSSWGVSADRRQRSSRSRPAPSVDGASRDSRLGAVAAACRDRQRSPLGCLKPVLQQLTVEGLYCSLAARRASSSRLRLMPIHMITSPAQLSRRVTTHLASGPRLTKSLPGQACKLDEVEMDL